MTAFKRGLALVTCVVLGVVVLLAIATTTTKPTKKERSSGFSAIEFAAEDGVFAAADMMEAMPTGRVKTRAASGKRLREQHAFAPNGDGPVQGTPKEEDARMLERTASLHIATATDVFRVETAVEALVEKYGGFVESSHRNVGHRLVGRNVQMTLRVPVEEFKTVTKAVVSSGNDFVLQSSSESVVDRTAEFVDVKARVQALEKSRDALYQLLEKATSVPDVLAVRTQLTDVISDLDAMSNRMAYIAKTASLSTIHLRLEQTAEKPTKPRPTMWSVLDVSWPRYLRRRFQKGLLFTATVFGLVIKISLTAIIYSVATSPLLLAGVLVVRLIRGPTWTRIHK